MVEQNNRLSRPVRIAPFFRRAALALFFGVFVSVLIAPPEPSSSATIMVHSLEDDDGSDGFWTGQIPDRGGAALPIRQTQMTDVTFVFTVTKTTDTFDAVCDADCSLREAVAAANGTAGDDDIHLPAGVYELTLDYSGVADDYGSLDITQEDQTTTILGAGRDVTIIDATKLRTVGVSFPDRVFSVRYHAGLELVGLKVTGGYTDNFSSSRRDGGGIWNWNGYLTVTDCLIEGNVAGVNGGGIANHYGAATISNTIVRDNHTAPPEYVTTGYGGGIYNSGAMTITSSTVESNASDRGGGIASELVLDEYPPSIVINNSTITGNGAERGGGIANLQESEMSIEESLITNNDALRDWDSLGSSNQGGGIWNSFGGTLTITNSTVSGNNVGATHAYHPVYGSGGGIANLLATLVMTGTTVSGNSATCDQSLAGDPDICGRGGGIINAGGTSTMTNSTISGNSVTLLNSTHEPYLGGGGGGGLAHMPHRIGQTAWCAITALDSTTITGNTADHGGGIDTRWESSGDELYDIEEWEVENNVYECAFLYVNNSIVSGNAVSVTAGTEDCWGGYLSLGYNLVGEGTGCPTNGVADIFAADPRLGPLADNGGETLTHELLVGSPAIDAGDNNNCPPTDQRGINRPQGAVCDIGAFELIPGSQANLGISKADTIDPILAGENITYTVTVSNSGPDSAQNVVVTDNLPGSVSYVSATPAQGSCGHAAGVVTCNLGIIPDAGQVNIQIIATTIASGTISNNATVTSDTSDPNPTNNAASEGTTVDPLPLQQANLGISKADSIDPIMVGENITYTVTVSNSGPDSAQNVVVTDDLVGSVSYVSATPAQGSCGHAGGVVTCDLGVIPNAGQVNIQIVVAATTFGTVTNNISVTSDTSDPDAGNNNTSEETTVFPLAVIYLPAIISN